ncbi:hypothetical protein L227DRAFT_568726 [Lentinus tigrinus ALCF2SS1-6]|uniref:Uncharacterized protein n=1 Tax=Lentinus tigrinus ALCF2SS1-6 TaxID=1328759 RepID=A0A5C2RMV7_9APHY|nr:hypothetical protein L227DRAFT_568726 [Lentinus tigrinus ALCF2SS1-6]
MQMFRNEEDTQPRIQNMIMYGDHPVLICNQEVGNAHFDALSESDTLCLGESEQKVYLLWGYGQLYNFNDQEIWADNLSDLVIETNDHQMVVGIQPQYENDKKDWLLGILLNNEEDDEIED